MKTRSIKQNEINEAWYILDAKGVRLGKLATKAAKLLIAKEDVISVDYLTPKNKVIVINSKFVDIHPRKVVNKMYYRHSGFIGGLKSFEYGTLKSEKPNRIVEIAIKGMLPKTKQGDKILKNLFVYEAEEHKHEAQKPLQVKI